MNWLRLLYAAAGLALDEWRDSRARRQPDRASPYSDVLVQCGRCGANVRADRTHMAEHALTCPGRP